MIENERNGGGSQDTPSTERSHPFSFRDSGRIEIPAPEILNPEQVLVRYASLDASNKRIIEGLAHGKRAAAFRMDADAWDLKVAELNRRFEVSGENGLIDVQATWAKLPETIRDQAVQSFSPERLVKTLSRRETQILRLTAAGLSSQEIAKELRLSPKTIHNHRARMLRKTGAGNVAELVAEGFRGGILS